MTREAVQLAVEYNARLAEQRRTLRKEYLDTQTKVSDPTKVDIAYVTFYSVYYMYIVVIKD